VPSNAQTDRQAGRQIHACSRCTQGLKQTEGLQGSLKAEIWDQGDAVGAWISDTLAAVVFPTAETLGRVRGLDRQTDLGPDKCSASAALAAAGAPQACGTETDGQIWVRHRSRCRHQDSRGRIGASGRMRV
jgi:hypothetical protein